MRPFSAVISIALVSLGVAAGIGVERYWLTGPAPAGDTALDHAEKHLEPGYVCPMHPEVTSPAPDSCPICGMELVAMKARKPAAEAGAPVVSVSPQFVHDFGVRTVPVERGPVSRRIETIGRVARMPQPRVADVAPGLPGRLVSVSGKEVGATVAKGERLYTVDTPEWRRLQRSFLAARESGDDARVAVLWPRLRALGMDDARLARLERSGEVEETLGVHAPQGGSIVEWSAMVDDAVNTKTSVVTLGGVNRIPVIVSVFEGQGAWIRRGQRAVFRIPSMPGIEFEGQVDRSDREINFSTRTLTVYAGFQTADPRIRYGMLVDVAIEASTRQNVLRVPREALIRTGAGERVVVDLGEGRFRAVPVVPGLESGDVVEVLSGLEEGDEVVVSGQFLIDSESSLLVGLGRLEVSDSQ